MKEENSNIKFSKNLLTGSQHTLSSNNMMNIAGNSFIGMCEFCKGRLNFVEMPLVVQAKLLTYQTDICLHTVLNMSLVAHSDSHPRIDLEHPHTMAQLRRHLHASCYHLLKQKCHIKS
jgi:hypothetical protein